MLVLELSSLIAWELQVKVGVSDEVGALLAHEPAFNASATDPVKTQCLSSYRADLQCPMPDHVEHDQRNSRQSPSPTASTDTDHNTGPRQNS